MDPKNKYTGMQQNKYDVEASRWSLDDLDPVVGMFKEHNQWQDYDKFLFKNLETKDKVALEFGCGPGRNLVKFADRFHHIDGVDISDINLENAKLWMKHNNVPISKLFKNNGTDLSCINTNNYYDVIFSTIVLQHICVHDIRFNLMSEFFRLLKPGGWICIQMGFGTRPNSVAYFDNNYDASGTNGICDTRIDNIDDLNYDLNKIGFSNLEYDIRPVGPGDKHQYWIFFRAMKS